MSNKNLQKVKNQQGKDDNHQEQKKDDCMNFYNPTGKDQLGLDKLIFSFRLKGYILINFLHNSYKYSIYTILKYILQYDSIKICLYFLELSSLLTD